MAADPDVTKLAARLLYLAGRQQILRQDVFSGRTVGADKIASAQDAMLDHLREYAKALGVEPDAGGR